MSIVDRVRTLGLESSFAEFIHMHLENRVGEGDLSYDDALTIVDIGEESSNRIVHTLLTIVLGPDFDEIAEEWLEEAALDL